MGYGLRDQVPASSSKAFGAGGRKSSPTTGCGVPIRGRSHGRQEQVEIKLGCSFEVHGGALAAIPGRPSSLLGLPFDRPVVGYGGQTINTLRLWAAAAPHQFDFQVFSAGEFVSALAERLAAELLTRVLYPDE